MGKHKRLAAAKAPDPAEDVLDAGQRIDEMLLSELARITSLQESMTFSLTNGLATPALLRESNGLSRALAQVSAEQRAREKHISILVDSLTVGDEDAIVMEFLSELPRPRRKAFFDLLQKLETTNDLLAL